MTHGGSLDLTLAPEPASVAQARRAILNALPELGAERENTVRLLISELVTNALRHSDSTEPVELHARWNSKVRVEVTDRGDGFNPGAQSEAAGGGRRLWPPARRRARGSVGSRDQ
jgi:signal transduction histidine kinase